MYIHHNLYIYTLYIEYALFITYMYMYMYTAHHKDRPVQALYIHLQYMYTLVECMSIHVHMTDLSTVVEVAKLSLPADQVVWVTHREPQFKSQHRKL